jgi:hypothetical protein
MSKENLSLKWCVLRDNAAAGAGSGLGVCPYLNLEQALSKLQIYHPRPGAREREGVSTARPEFVAPNRKGQG